MLKKIIVFLLSTAFYGILAYWKLKIYGKSLWDAPISWESCVILFGPFIGMILFSSLREEAFALAFLGAPIMAGLIMFLLIVIQGLCYAFSIVIPIEMPSIYYYIYIVVMWLMTFTTAGYKNDVYVGGGSGDSPKSWERDSSTQSWEKDSSTQSWERDPGAKSWEWDPTTESFDEHLTKWL